MYQQVIKFWFEELQPEQWFNGGAELDRLISERFTDLLIQARKGELSSWRTEPQGRLAEIIVLDQFSRNVYRDSAEAFSADPMALVLAQEAIRCGDDQKLSPQMRIFCYLPYMHSESKVIHQDALVLFENLGLASNLDFEHKHKAIIDRFGRYPHRNQLLGRESTAEELEFLQQPGSSF